MGVRVTAYNNRQASINWWPMECLVWHILSSWAHHVDKHPYSLLAGLMAWAALRLRLRCRRRARKHCASLARAR